MGEYKAETGQDGLQDNAELKLFLSSKIAQKEAMEKQSPIRNLKLKRRDLIENYLKKTEDNFQREHARLIDNYFLQGFEEIKKDSYIDDSFLSLIALGGYGRREQCLHSDIDILLLFKEEGDKETELIIQKLIYPLWDLGFEVSYAVRSIEDSIKLASENLEVLTSILDGRLILGNSLLFSSLIENFKAFFIEKQGPETMHKLIEGNKKRHSQFGDSTHLLEPNLKSGQGGLRDYHTMLWLGRVKFDLREIKDLEYQAYLSWEELEKFKKALNFIWLVRNHLHYLAKRKCDQLYFEHQSRLAETLGFSEKNKMTAVEHFLSKLHSEMDLIKQHLLMLINEVGHKQKLGLKPRDKEEQTKVQGLIIKNGLLNFKSMEDILERPELLLEIFKESGAKKTGLSAEAKRMVKEMSYLLGPEIFKEKRYIDIFEDIISTPSFDYHPLNEMLSTKLLSRLIPEFELIANRIQYNRYHIYPVDKHSIHSVEKLADLASGRADFNSPYLSFYYKNFQKIENKSVLFWAALLHDIGKGVSYKDHSSAGADLSQKILKNFHIDEKDKEAIVFLVREHLLLVKTATRRDINNEETIISSALKVHRADYLHMLFFLSLADSISTGPKAWNEWTENLLVNLYLRVLKVLEKGDLAESKAIDKIKDKQKKILESIDKDEFKDIENLLSGIPPAYLLELSIKDILSHLKLSKKRKGENFEWQIEKIDELKLRKLLIHADDKPGLFYKAAAAFTLNNIDILDARIYSWKDGSAANLFILKAPVDKIFEDDIWEKSKKDLKRLLEGKIELSSIISKLKDNKREKKLKTRESLIRIDNESSSFYTIIEVHAYDFPGLLFQLTYALFQCRLDIKNAKIATKVDQIVDIFYVRDFNGNKINSREDEEFILEKLREVIKDK